MNHRFGSTNESLVRLNQKNRLNSVLINPNSQQCQIRYNPYCKIDSNRFRMCCELYEKQHKHHHEETHHEHHEETHHEHHEETIKQDDEKQDDEETIKEDENEIQFHQIKENKKVKFIKASSLRW